MAAELGLELDEDEIASLLDAVKRTGARKRGLVSDAEFRRLVGRRRRASTS